MKSTLRDVAETRFAALVRREDAAMSAIEAEAAATREKTERLRALRMARDAQAIADQARTLRAKRGAKTDE